ncbi:MAG: GAF domain-containing protein [Leptolyngbyaceae bacterium]|nr:GAF domain-containing protein [Leptolyngbyaceae bacterium]
MTSHQDHLFINPLSTGDRPITDRPVTDRPSMLDVPIDASAQGVPIDAPNDVPIEAQSEAPVEAAPSSNDDMNATNGVADTSQRHPTVLSHTLLPQPQPLWFQHLEAHTHRLLAALHPLTQAIEWINQPFAELGDGLPLQDNPSAITELCHYHVLYRLLQHLQPAGLPAGLPQWRLLNESVMLTVHSSACSSNRRNGETRYIQAWIRSDTLQVKLHRPSDEISGFLNIPSLDEETWRTVFNDRSRLQEWCHQCLELITSGIVTCVGSLLLEGVDITAQESIRRITQLLVDQNSVLQFEKFEQVNAQMCELFRADNTAIVCFQRQNVRLFMGNVSDDLNVAEYSFDELKDGQMMEAIAHRTLMLVPDLQDQCFTELGERLLALGVRSLLLIPLMAEQVTCGHHTEHPIGLVGVLSHTPHRFDAVDQRRAEQLVPAFTAALTTALRQMHHKQFINTIHPSVEWRFIQEAERRSLGMMPEPIVFQDVYPLYGISDIRGSSQERNRAIQADLLEQLQLGLAVVEAVCAVQAGTFVEQLRLDVLDKIAELEQDITVGAEVTVSRYLSDRLEAHFDHFVQTHPSVEPVVNAYRHACHPKQGGVYRARAHYDFLLGQITSRLRATWDEWQGNMQRIIPHYCDVEVTDGIDHMIYAGGAIAVQFSPFYLQSLRYEQLRAVCACARTAFDIQAEFNSSLEVTHLILVQDSTVDIFHDEDTERLFDVQGTRDTRYEIVKKRIDKAVDADRHTRITQPGMLTVVYSTEQEEDEYREYLRYLAREGWVDSTLHVGTVEPLQGVSGLRFLRVSVLPHTAGSSVS